MTLLSVVKDVCAAVGVPLPQSIFSNITGNRTMQEMLSLANEMAQRIAYDTRDWTRLKKTVTYTGDGVTTAFDLPADYKRMLLTSNVWRSTSTSVADAVHFRHRRVAEPPCRGTSDSARGEWTMLGGQIHFSPALAVGETAYFAYLHKNCVALAGGGCGDVFSERCRQFRARRTGAETRHDLEWKQKKGSRLRRGHGHLWRRADDGDGT